MRLVKYFLYTILFIVVSVFRMPDNLFIIGAKI